MDFEVNEMGNKEFSWSGFKEENFYILGAA